ncbi:hypothetical protein TNCV_94941 [Trichonephila clavipes]|nr:hypothetical protein TNCV_94941 [Trichonephila clavipes]
MNEHEKENFLTATSAGLSIGYLGRAPRSMGLGMAWKGPDKLDLTRFFLDPPVPRGPLIFHEIFLGFASAKGAR